MEALLVANRYRFVELLGKGGMGEVSRVFDTVLGREVALKNLLVTDETKSAAALELFEREFQTLSELSHPRIIEVYDYGLVEGGAYYTMELLTGSDLRTMGKVPWTTACSLLRDLASSLAIIHSRRLIHADLSPRNVRCTGDGRAKLLDFGAMMPMRPCRHIAGTPPFVAPETLEGLPLDGRADLFGFGALAYWMLTGRHAYPARELADLLERWQTPPLSPRVLEPTIPEWLSELIMSCLSLDRSSRPRTAGVVMDRICRLASLPLEEHRDVATAYLTTPGLVGRAEPVARVRRKLAGATGGTLIVAGAIGSGRSRFLDTCVLEAKLVGRRVVHVAAAAAGSEPYAAARAIIAQLNTLAASSLTEALKANVARVLDSRDTGASEPTPLDALDELLDALVATVSSTGALLIAVDDADRIDDDSKGLLLSMTQRAERQTPCIVLTVDSAGESSVALDALRRRAETISLEPFTEQQTEELVQSVFGTVTHSVSLASRLHAAAAGRPKLVLQLAATLVERDLVRYEAGSFVLPEWLHDDELPDTLGGALERRFDILSADAADLVCALALTEARDLPVASYADLTGHEDRRRTFRAVDELVRAEMLVADGDRYRIENGTWHNLVTKKLSPDELRAFHARLARQFESTGKVNRRAFHLKRSGDTKAAVLVLLAQFIKDPNEPRDPLEDYVPGVLEFLEEMAHAAEDLDIPVAFKIELWMKTLGACQFVGDIERFRRLAPPLLERLKRDSGLLDYEELKAANAAATVFEAFGRVQARFDAAVESERGLPLPDAMREVARLCVMHSSAASISVDISLARCIPDLGPLAVLSPAIAAIKQMLEAMRLMVEGRSNAARLVFFSLLERLEDPDRAGLGELYHRSLRLGALYIVGLLEAASGIPTAAERAVHLENESGHRVNAQRIYMTSLLMSGDLEGAAAAQRRAEVLMLQEARYQRYPGTTARSELYTCIILDDVAGVKELVERFTKAAVGYPKWGVYTEMARHHHRRLQGDLKGALASLEAAFRVTAPLEHREWPAIAAAHVQILTDLGRAEEAIEIGRIYLDTCRRLELHPGVSQVSQSVARALLASGDAPEAASMVDAVIAETVSAGHRGLPLGVLYELRARIALVSRDEQAFERHVELCRKEYRVDLVPALGGKMDRLVREARRTSERIARRSQYPDLDANLLTAIAGSTAEDRLFSGADPATRISSVLEVLIASLQPRPDAAFLFGVRGDSPYFLAGMPATEVPPEIEMAAESFMEGQTEVDEFCTRTTFLTEEVERPVSPAGGVIHSIPLMCKLHGEGQIAGVVVIRTDGPTAPLSPRIAEVLGAALLQAVQGRLATSRECG